MKRLFFCILSLLLFSAPADALDVPKFLGHVNDYANMISSDTKMQIEEKLRALQQTDSTQIVVLTISSLEGEAIEDFGIKVAEAWKVGQKNKDNGVILIASKQDKKLRIEVGRGLEGKLTDLEAGRIIDLVIKPQFKKGDFDGGFISGVTALIATTKGEFSAAGEAEGEQYNYKLFIGLLIICFVSAFVMGRIRPLQGAGIGLVGAPFSALIAGMSDASSIIMIAIFGGTAAMLISALASGFFGKGRKSAGRRSGGYDSRHSSEDSDFGSSSSSSGSTSSSDSSDSGGGGDFGGGGASGDWD